MSDEKLIKKFLTDERHITFDDCKCLLSNYGYILHKSAGSHRIFHKKGSGFIIVIIPKGTKYIKSPYVKQIVKDLKLEA
jgi:predicted RNA binding protein YcfA (HicA-like mRNA interferase family)